VQLLQVREHGGVAQKFSPPAASNDT
jgi:xanthine dehydrogenase accessory factor